jgi:hypothetical protein
VLVVALLLALEPVAREGYRSPAHPLGRASAELVVRVAERGPGPGLGRVQMQITVNGPRGLEVEPARIQDAVAAWKVRLACSGWQEDEQGEHWEELIDLVQVKPGLASLPSVRLRARVGNEEWQDTSWTDPLEGSLGPPPVELPTPPPPSPWLVWLALAGGVLLAVVLGLLAGWWLGLFRGRRRIPESPQALALARLSVLQPPPAGDAQEFHAALADILRELLARRYTFPALQSTTADLLDTLRRHAEPPDPAWLEQLRDQLEACDRVKYAGLAPAPDECRARADQARGLIEGLPAPAPVGQSREGEAVGQPGELR